MVNKHNNILYAVPYQHFTNSIENYFSMLKSRLQKLDGLTHEKLKVNITNVIRVIPKEKYENIFKGAYNRDVLYVKHKTRKRKLKNYKTISFFEYYFSKFQKLIFFLVQTSLILD